MIKTDKKILFRNKIRTVYISNNKSYVKIKNNDNKFQYVVIKQKKQKGGSIETLKEIANNAKVLVFGASNSDSTDSSEFKDKTRWNFLLNNQSTADPPIYLGISDMDPLWKSITKKNWHDDEFWTILLDILNDKKFDIIFIDRYTIHELILNLNDKDKYSVIAKICSLLTEKGILIIDNYQRNFINLDEKIMIPKFFDSKIFFKKFKIHPVYFMKRDELVNLNIDEWESKPFKQVNDLIIKLSRNMFNYNFTIYYNNEKTPEKLKNNLCIIDFEEVLRIYDNLNL